MIKRMVSSAAFLTLIIGLLMIISDRHLKAATHNNDAANDAANGAPETPGSLVGLDKDGKPYGRCPLKHTDVKTEISGFLARVVVTQEFENPFSNKIEAVYTFPLSQNAAVDDMTMIVGTRTVRGLIKRREEAQAIYDQARRSGRVASLLDQERPNIFTQSVANIMPGEQIKIVISYVETLKYDDGAYQFVFPMVVGPRYIPGNAIGKQANGYAPDTDRVPDASRITPKSVESGNRAGHDISLEVTLDAGVPITRMTSQLHEVAINKLSDHNAVVTLKQQHEIPNKDFILKYDVAGGKMSDAMLLHRSKKGGFFTLILQPPQSVTAEDVRPKELVFVLDTSGSMNGFPIEKAKETMKMALAGLYPRDTFNLITFAGDTHVLFPKPVPANDENLAKAQAFLQTRSGGGGTEMMKAIRTALEPSDQQDHIRIVCFMTDGYVGNDFEIISEIQKHPNARVFSFGIGNSVNRFLLDKMAEEGRGEVEYVSLNDDGTKAAVKFHERIRNPLFTDIAIDWGGLPIKDVYPKRIPDMFSTKPVILTGRFDGGGHGVVKLKGKMSGDDFVKEVALDLPDEKVNNHVISTLWARQKIDDLMKQDYAGLQRGIMKPDVKEEITKLGLEYRLLTQFTSFVAVEDRVVTDNSIAPRVDVPVETPAGVNSQAVGGTSAGQGKLIPGFGAILETSPQVLLSSPIRTDSANSTQTASTEIVAVQESGQAITISTSDQQLSTLTDNKKISELPVQGRNMIVLTPGVTGAQQSDDCNTCEIVTVTGKPKRKERKEHEEVAQPIDQQYLSKLHPTLLTALLQSKGDKIEADSVAASFIKNGKISLQLQLADSSPELLKQLKSLGFEIDGAATNNIVTGRLPLKQLTALARLDKVLYVLPQLSSR